MALAEADNLKKITINKFKEWGLLTPKDTNFVNAGTINWTRTVAGTSEPNGSVSYEIEYQEFDPHKLILGYTVGDSGTSIEYTVKFTKIKCNYGGYRWFFLCPGAQCDKRCSKLYLHRQYFLCRTCHNLTYESNNRTKSYRNWDSIVKYLPDFSYDPTPFDKLYRRATRYPTYMGKPTKASLKVLRQLRNLPSPEEQEGILMRSMGL